MLNTEEIQVFAEGFDASTPPVHVDTTFTYIVFTTVGATVTGSFDFFTDADGSVWLCGKGAGTPNGSYRVQATSANGKTKLTDIFTVTAPAAAVVDHVVVSLGPPRARTHFAP